MEIVRFSDQYDLAGPLFGEAPDALRKRDDGLEARPVRWLALTGNEAVGSVTAITRPDRKTFLSFRPKDLSSLNGLITVATSELGGPLFTSAARSEERWFAALMSAGFDPEVEFEGFEVPFAAALTTLSRARLPSGFAVHSADSVDAQRLFTLDNTIRQDVPGTQGWRGNISWFRNEMSESPPFDPGTYLVGVDQQNGEYAGLVRIWRNEEGPRLGLLGVLRQYRRSTLAAALLNRSLEAAQRWGHDAFSTETALTNRAVYPRLVRMGATSTGRFAQMVLR